jgi:hypothetical protein
MNMLPQKRVELVKLVQQYDLPFENIMDDKKTRQCFNDYLKSNLNEEPFLFMNELDHYVTLIGTKTRYKAAKRIVDDYLLNTSPHAINISNSLRQEAYDNLAKSDESNCPKDLFDAIRLHVYMDLKQCLPNFLDSDMFRTHVMESMKHDSKYLESVGSPKADSCTQDDSTDEQTQDDSSTKTDMSTHDNAQNITDIYDPKILNVTDVDFERVLAEVKDECMWKRVQHNSKRSLYISQSALFNGKRGLKKMKEITIYPYPVDEVFYALIDERYFDAIEKGFKDPKNVQFHKFGKYAGTIIHKKLKLPLMQLREFLVMKSARKEKNGSYIIAKKSVELDKIPRTKGCIRGMAIAGTLIEKIDEKNTRVTLVAYADLGGWTSPAVFNRLAALADDSKYKSTLSVLKQRRGVSLGEPGRSFGILDTLKHFEAFKE